MYTPASVKEAKRVLKKTADSVPETHFYAPCYIGLQEIYRTDTNILEPAEKIHELSNSAGLPSISIVLIHIKEVDTIKYLVNEGFFDLYKEFGGNIKHGSTLYQQHGFLGFEGFEEVPEEFKSKQPFSAFQDLFILLPNRERISEEIGQAYSKGERIVANFNELSLGEKGGIYLEGEWKCAMEAESMKYKYLKILMEEQKGKVQFVTSEEITRKWKNKNPSFKDMSSQLSIEFLKGTGFRVSYSAPSNASMLTFTNKIRK